MNPVAEPDPPNRLPRPENKPLPPPPESDTAGIEVPRTEFSTGLITASFITCCNTEAMMLLATLPQLIAARWPPTKALAMAVPTWSKAWLAALAMPS